MNSPRKSKSVQIQCYNSSFQNEWNNYIEKSPHSVFAHHLGWKDVVEKTYGHKPFYLMAYRNDRVVGVSPLFFIKSFIFGKFMVTSPFLTFGGIIVDDEDATTALIDQMKKIAFTQSVRYIEIRNEKQIEYPLRNKSIYCTLILNLTPGADTLWHSCLHSSTRRNIQKAYQSGLKIEEGHQNLKHFVNINTHNMRRLGTPAHGYPFFSNIIQYFPESTLLMVRSGHTFIGGMILVYFKNTVLMPWVASLQPYFHLRPNNLLYWEAILRGVDNGYHFLDFGRSKWNSGTFRFKSQYGAKPVQLNYQYYMNRIRKVPDIDPDNVIFKYPISIWKRLPLSVTKLFGYRLIRYIP